MVYLLLTLHIAHFNDLAIFGSELDDLEDTNDAEPDRLTGEIELDDCDDEPSLGAAVGPASMADLEEPGYGFVAKDRAIIAAARARYKKPPEPERHGALTYTTVDPETQRAGAWILERRKGGAK